MVLAGLACFGVAGVAEVRWLWPHLTSSDRGPVLAYILVIVLMCASAAGSARAVGSVFPAIGAVSFMASDVSVARDQFVMRSVNNRLWGLPLYYAPSSCWPGPSRWPCSAGPHGSTWSKLMPALRRRTPS